MSKCKKKTSAEINLGDLLYFNWPDKYIRIHKISFSFWGHYWEVKNGIKKKKLFWSWIPQIHSDSIIYWRWLNFHGYYRTDRHERRK